MTDPELPPRAPCPRCGRSAVWHHVPPAVLCALFLLYANGHGVLASVTVGMVAGWVWALGALGYGLWRAIRSDPDLYERRR